MKYKTLAIRHPNDLVFGYAPNPVKTKRGLEFGAGTVYPELNFTLPPMQVSKANLPLLLEQYKGIANDALTRARELHTQGLVLEFEALLEMTMNPEIGVEIIKVMNDIGKNLVAMMVEGAGWKVVDLGVDVGFDKIKAALDENPGSIVGLSALLTTTMVNMKGIVDQVKAIDNNSKVMVGGAPLTQDYCNEIGADFYSPDPQGAVDYLNKIVS